MDLKQALDRWLQRHATGPNRLLHAIGIPATVIAAVALFLHLWLLAAICLVGGYLLQTIGHYLEGSRVGEILLLKKIVFPTGGFIKRLLITFLLLAGLVIGALFIQSLFNKYLFLNLHQAVAPGMYRSAQLPPERLAKLIRRLGIKTVVNLRGQEDKPWYTAEQAVVAENGADLINLPFRATVYPSPAQLGKLVDVVEQIKPPFLVHCKGGSDRTGLFFVLLALREGKSWSQAMGQLSFLRFNHRPATHSATITYPLYDFADYAAQHNWPPDLKQFRKWLTTDHARHSFQSRLQQQNASTAKR